ncbi:MAG: hypothetical protein V1735_07375 [Nanoarchaeota archaeon]
MLATNRVPDHFPLLFLYPGYPPINLLEVSLDDRMEENETTRSFRESTTRFMGGRPHPEEYEASLRCLLTDRFGETNAHADLDSLLAALPEPKTLITDLFIVDHFPQLAEMGFEPVIFPKDATVEGWMRKHEGLKKG